MNKEHCSKGNLALVNGMIRELRRIATFGRIDPDGKALLSEAEQKLVKFHKERSK